MNESMNVIGDEFHSQGYAMGLRKGSPLKERIDYLLVRYLDEGLIENWCRIWYDITGHTKHRVQVEVDT